ncbi:hypothetical protein GCM10009828_095440 [Actinoplanes couchii]|uniref:Uncharacterized protein n=1 Tax=Actinoplanes couchii TaxID=403638 RepID=A0ABQ3XTL5_9ACTN|nr:hypothetical protein Aco03nite_102600 [Actinoplanes couchii]
MRSSEHGDAVIRWLRPRATTVPILRSRGPVSLQIYIAAREKRLVWRSAKHFLLLEKPGVPHQAPADSPWTARGLRVVDEYWPVLVGLSILYLAAVPVTWWLINVRRGTASGPLSMAAAWALLAIIALFFVVFVSAAMRDCFRTMLPRDPVAYRGGMAVDEMRTQHWSVQICHTLDSASLRRDLNLLLSQSSLDGRLLVLERGITTSDACETVLTSPYAGQLVTGPRALLLSRDASWRVTLPDLPERFWQWGRYAVYYVWSVLLVTVSAFLARVVADVEAAACADGDCSGRPVTYWDALYWLLSRLVSGDPEGMSAATASIRIVGLLATAAGMVLLAGLLVNSSTTAINRRLTAPEVAGSPDGLVALNEPPAIERPADTDSRRAGRPAAVVSAATALMCSMAIGVYLGSRLRDRA